LISPRSRHAIYRGVAIAETDAAFINAVRLAKIDKMANFYSIRHALARCMRRMRVDLEEIGISATVIITPKPRHLDLVPLEARLF
jgi:hypothetical protein